MLSRIALTAFRGLPNKPQIRALSFGIMKTKPIFVRHPMRFLATEVPLTKTMIEDRVLLVLRNFDKIDPNKLTIDSHFVNDLNIDSLSLVEIVSEIEAEFSRWIPTRKIVMIKNYQIPRNLLMKGSLFHETNDPMFDSLTISVMEAKRANPGMFVSAWEADEQDINPWTDAQLKSDPAKMFIVAAEQGNAMTLELIASSASHDDGPSLSDLVTATDCDGYTALHRAVYNGHCKVAEMLLDMGANVNHRTNDGWTPLHSAAFWNKLSCVQALMTAGADITAVTNGQQTVLHLAVSNGQSCETLLFLLSHPDAPLWVKNGAGDSVKDLILRNTPYADLIHLLSRAANCSE